MSMNDTNNRILFVMKDLNIHRRFCSYRGEYSSVKTRTLAYSMQCFLKIVKILYHHRYVFAHVGTIKIFGNCSLKVLK